MRLLCLLLASGALAQTSNPPPLIPAESPAVSIPQAPMRGALEKQKASIARQQMAVRRQAENAGAHMLPPEAPAAACDTIGDVAVGPIVESAAKRHQIAPELIRAVIGQESGFQPCAISRKGALGLMQLMPATAEQFGVTDAFDPKQNIDTGTKYLKQLLDRYAGDLTKALSAYNAGPSTVDQAGGTPDIQETRDYVAAILKKLDATRTVQPNTPKPKPTGN